MKILMITSDHIVIDRRIIQEAESLSNYGYQVELLAGFECKRNEKFFIGKIAVERNSFDWVDQRYISFLPFLKGPLAKIRKGIYRYYSKFFLGTSSFEQFVINKIKEKEFDIIHIHDFTMLKVGVLVAQQCNKKCIYDAHELYPAQSILPKKIRALYHQIEKKYAKFPEEVITVNEFIASEFVKKYRIKTPKVIYNATPLKDAERKNLIRERFQFDKDDKIILYQGWISKERSIDKLIYAAEYFNQKMKLVLVGYGEYVRELKTIVEKMGLQSSVYFYGKVASEDMHAISCSADIGIIPYRNIDLNHYYCSPNKLFEYINAELPVVANNLPFLNKVIHKFNMGTVTDTANPEVLAKALSDILFNLVTMDNLKTGVIKAKQTLNWELEEKKLIEIYKNIQNKVDVCVA